MRCNNRDESPSSFTLKITIFSDAYTQRPAEHDGAFIAKIVSR